MTDILRGSTDNILVMTEFTGLKDTIYKANITTFVIDDMTL